MEENQSLQGPQQLLFGLEIQVTSQSSLANLD